MPRWAFFYLLCFAAGAVLFVGEDFYDGGETDEDVYHHGAGGAFTKDGGYEVEVSGTD